MTPISIDRVELRYGKIPLVRAFRTSFGGHLDSLKHFVLVTVYGEGLVGWGEAAMMEYPGYSYETVETVWHVLKDFMVPELLSETAQSPEHAAEHWSRWRGHNMAKAGLEMAVMDLFAQAEKKSMAEYLWKKGSYKGKRSKQVAVGVSTGLQPSVEETLDVIAERLELGYQRIKIKIEPGNDLHLVKAIRERFPEIKLMVDANSAYKLEDSDMLREFDQYNLMMIEQPLYHDDIHLHSKLQSQLDTSICLDESIHTLRDAQHALEIVACRIINIKPGRLGGLLVGQRVHDYCYQRDVPVWCGGMLETGVGRAANVAIATLPGFILPGDISASERYFKRDIIEQPFELNDDSTLTVPKGHGLGVTVDMDYLDSLLVREIDMRKG